MPRKPTNKQTPEGNAQNLQYIGEELLDRIIGSATISLLKQGKPVTVETLREAVKADTEFKKDWYAATHELLDSISGHQEDKI